MKSKKIAVYEDKKTGTIFINPMEEKNGKFVIKSPVRDYGSANGKNISNEELGKRIREAIKQAD